MRVALITFLCILSLHSTTSVTFNSYKLAAKHWFNTYIYQKPISTFDLRIIINIAYLSYLRSSTTLKAQEAALQSLQTVWKSWQNVSHIRRNPSKPIPYILTTKEKKNVQEFFTLQEKHTHASVTYNIAVHMLAENEIIPEELANTALKELKLQARKYCMSQLIDIKKHTSDLYYYLTTMPAQRSLFDTVTNNVISQLPFMILSSFAKTDQAHIACSENGFKSLMFLQETGNYIWRTLETARAEWYYEVYSLLYEYLEQFDPKVRVIMFTELGYVNRISQALPMPHPQQLK